MGSTHENTIDRTWLDAQSTKHAFGIVNCVAGNLKSFTALDSFLANVDAIDGACLGALIASDARGQVETVKSAIASRNRDCFLRVLELLGECAAILKICL
jgi:hypothetical protein